MIAFVILAALVLGPGTSNRAGSAVLVAAYAGAVASFYLTGNGNR